MPTKPDHDIVLKPREWWACEFPERPLDWYAIGMQDCPFCLLHIQAELKNRPDMPVWDFYEGDDVSEYVPVKDVDAFLKRQAQNADD